MRITDKQKAVVWLQAIVGLNSAKINKLEESVDLTEVMRQPMSYADKLSPILGVTCARRLKQGFDNKQVEDIFRDLEQKGCGVIVRGDNAYPETLENIDVPPAVLYYKGDIGLLKTRALGVVGTREPSRYGRDYTEKFVEILAKCSLTIVSGLARGVDSVAHRVTLENNGKTIAVLGTGIDVIFPATNETLYHDIAREGLIISEFCPGTPALAFNFPERNRIISGISNAVLITEAGEKSGSLITADCAIKQNKDLFIIPSALNSPRGMGGNRLLKTCQAAMVLSPDDIIEAMGIKPQPQKRASAMQLDFIEEKLIEALTYSELHFDDLIDLTGLGVSDLNALLVRMEIVGLVKKLDNNYYGV
ncbi:MAG: DNA-processing protein DprA [Clostridia bacterium]|nr:DNA-processing protein DprA [Clostridia bacterium]